MAIDSCQLQRAGLWQAGVPDGGEGGVRLQEVGDDLSTASRDFGVDWSTGRLLPLCKLSKTTENHARHLRALRGAHALGEIWGLEKSVVWNFGTMIAKFGGCIGVPFGGCTYCARRRPGCTSDAEPRPSWRRWPRGSGLRAEARWPRRTAARREVRSPPRPRAHTPFGFAVQSVRRAVVDSGVGNLP